MRALSVVLLLVCLVACETSLDRLPSGAPQSSRAGGASESPLSLSKEKVPRETFHLDGLVADARFIEDTTTGGFKVRPRVDVDPGSRIDLVGTGCKDADSVHVAFVRMEPLRAGQHDREQTWIDTATFAATRSGWTGTLRVPPKPPVADYAVWALCELDGHGYFPSSWNVLVGRGIS